MDKFGEIIPIDPKVISQNALSFGLIIKSSLLKKLLGTPVPDTMYVSKLWPCILHVTCKNLKRQHPLGANYGLLKKLTLGGSACPAITFC